MSSVRLGRTGWKDLTAIFESREEFETDLGLKGRVAIVTGSSQGIGKAIALGLAQEGALLTICARTERRLVETAKEIESSFRTQVLALRTDLAKRNDLRRLVKETEGRFGGIDILVNNTGGPPTAPFMKISEEDWRQATDSLLMSVVFLCLEVIPHMQKRHWGRIINMTSIAAKQPVENFVLSNSLRAGILGLSKTLSNELARDNILVNSVCPGWTWTSRTDELAKEQSLKTGVPYEEVVREWEKEILLGRLAQPREIADLVVFLSSERASYLTGATLQVDGGWVKAML